MPRRTEQPVSAAPTKAANITELLRRDIITCRFAPGTKLPFETLMHRYGVSISTLRESLAALAVEGLVSTRVRRGFWVSDVSREDLKDLTLVRATIESKALRLCFERGDEEWEGRVLHAHHVFRKALERRPESRDSFGSQSQHLDLHASFLAACGSPRLLELTRHLLSQTDRYRHIFYEYMTAPHEEWATHDPIVEAIVSRDVERACRLLEHHIESSTEYLLSRIDPAHWQARLGDLRAGLTIDEIMAAPDDGPGRT